MAQAFLTYQNRIKMQRMNFYKESVNVSTQTGDENVDIVYHLPNNKKIRLYHSNTVFKINLDEAQFYSSKNSLKLDYEAYLIYFCFVFFLYLCKRSITYHLKKKFKKNIYPIKRYIN